MDVKFYYRWDDRRIILLPGNRGETIAFAAEQWIETVNHAIRNHGRAVVALSGGSTPKSIFQVLSSTENQGRVDWAKVLLFWSDERAAPPSHPDSNFRMAMVEGGLSKLPIPKEHIFRMVAEENIEENAQKYESIIRETLNDHSFDLIMLGMGDDGHTASLFPKSRALRAQGRLVVSNRMPKTNAPRMTFTYECINASQLTCIYVLGQHKSETIKKVFLSSFDPETYPAQKIGTKEHPAVWVLDEEAGKNLITEIK